ncbi:hypothetical protein JXJ21_19735 [candidate division KSB1 bacterium]|nr:hypothetical protein [candidate division KSB1 bacterium]
MKLAIGSDDKTTIRKGNFSDSRYFVVFEILNAQVHSQEVREKVRRTQLDELLEFLQDCEILMAQAFSKQMLNALEQSNMQLVTTTVDGVKEALSSYLEFKDEFFKTYDKKASRFISCKWC